MFYMQYEDRGKAAKVDKNVAKWTKYVTKRYFFVPSIPCKINRGEKLHHKSERTTHEKTHMTPFYLPYGPFLKRKSDQNKNPADPPLGIISFESEAQHGLEITSKLIKKLATVAATNCLQLLKIIEDYFLPQQKLFAAAKNNRRLYSATANS